MIIDTIQVDIIVMDTTTTMDADIVMVDTIEVEVDTLAIDMTMDADTRIDAL